VSPRLRKPLKRPSLLPIRILMLVASVQTCGPSRCAVSEPHASGLTTIRSRRTLVKARSSVSVEEVTAAWPVKDSV
jgi:hypothetical protein